ADKNGKSSGKHGKKDKKEDKKDEGRWDMLTDTYGRTYWQHSITGDWSYGMGGLVSPAVTVNPSPVGFAGPAVFTPSPVPAGYAPYPFVALAPKKEEGKDEDKKEDKEKGRGWWETMYDDDGDKYWEHTVTKKKTYKDPYY
ncbi:unnamed protein product, partial [Pylaiella littoralis]